MCLFVRFLFVCSVGQRVCLCVGWRVTSKEIRVEILRGVMVSIFLLGRTSSLSRGQILGYCRPSLRFRTVVSLVGWDLVNGC